MSHETVQQIHFEKSRGVQNSSGVQFKRIRLEGEAWIAYEADHRIETI
jgi:hypothetical protein